MFIIFMFIICNNGGKCAISKVILANQLKLKKYLTGISGAKNVLHLFGNVSKKLFVVVFPNFFYQKAMFLIVKVKCGCILNVK